MAPKSKLPTEEKVRLVEAYLAGQINVAALYKIHGIYYKTLSRWVRRYQERGMRGLSPSSSNRKYSYEIKRRAIADYLSGSGSQRDICTRYDISSERMLYQWIKRYNEHGDFVRPNSGGAIYMAKGRKTTLDERIEIVGYCIANNKDYGKAIEQYGVSYQQIYEWVRKYEKSGPDGLSDHRGKRKDAASMTEVERLRAQLKLKEAENLRLQMENELLKKLEALERGRDEG